MKSSFLERHSSSLRNLASTTTPQTKCHGRSTIGGDAKPNVTINSLLLSLAQRQRGTNATAKPLLLCITSHQFSSTTAQHKLRRQTLRYCCCVPSEGPLMGVFGAHGLAPRNYLWCTGPSPCTTEDLPSSSSLFLAARIPRSPISSSLCRAHLARPNILLSLNPIALYRAFPAQPNILLCFIL